MRTRPQSELYAKQKDGLMLSGTNAAPCPSRGALPQDRMCGTRHSVCSERWVRWESGSMPPGLNRESESSYTGGTYRYGDGVPPSTSGYPGPTPQPRGRWLETSGESVPELLLLSLDCAARERNLARNQRPAPCCPLCCSLIRAYCPFVLLTSCQTARSIKDLRRYFAGFWTPF